MSSHVQFAIFNLHFPFFHIFFTWAPIGQRSIKGRSRKPEHTFVLGLNKNFNNKKKQLRNKIVFKKKQITVSIPKTDFTKTDNKLPNLHIWSLSRYSLLARLGKCQIRPSVLIVFPVIDFSHSMFASTSRKIFRI